jgi:transcriptional regulator with XRE-family HTH domain
MGGDIMEKKEKVRGLEYENRLKEIRTQAGLSQRELGKVIGRPQTFISRIQVGDILPANMSVRNVYKLAEALGCRMEDIIGAPYLEALPPYREEELKTI